MSLIMLFLTFCYVGLFTIGGGMAAIPLIENVCVSNGLTTVTEFYQMVAISESTPGPIGINIATYAGYMSQGVAGGIVASLGLITPPFIICVLLIKLLDKYSKTPLVKAMFVGLRAVIIGLICTALLSIVKICLVDVSLFTTWDQVWNIFNWKAWIILVVIAFLYFKFKKHPLLYIGLGAVLGILIL